MRVLLSAVGTRGDVQPVVALGLAVRRLGHDVHLAVPPNFVEWAQELGFGATSVGIEMRAPSAGARPAVAAPVAPFDLYTDQFETVGSAIRGCDLVLGANAHQYAARSLAELHEIPYVNALYAPTALPTPETTKAWNERALERVNANRARLGLAPIDDVLRHIVTDHPWLATDPTLDPKPAIAGMQIAQTGAWLLADERPLDPELAAFLDAGDPPVYLGFGSMPAQGETSRTLIDAVRSVGRRAIVSRGWAELSLVDDAPDCIAICDVNHHALFPRVAAVVHHGGAGTTVTAARAGAPQVVAPMYSDQPYWAQRVRELGIGASVPSAGLSAEGLASALREALTPAVATRARELGEVIVTDGAEVAARRLVAL